MTVAYQKPADITADIKDCLPQSRFGDPPEIQATDDAAAGGSGTSETYTELAGPGGAASAADASFVYLDVGLWAGDGDPGWPKARDFGLIHGPIVWLCTFEKQTASKLGSTETMTAADLVAAVGPNQPTPADGAAIDYSGNLLEVLKALSGGSMGNALRRVEIIAKTTPPAPAVAGPPAPEPIYVIVGDMHIPLADKADTPDSVSPGRVKRAGRIDLKPLQDIVNDLIPVASADPTANLTAILGWATKLSMDPAAKKAAASDWWGLALQFAPEILAAGTAAVVTAPVTVPAALGVASSPSLWDPTAAAAQWAASLASPQVSEIIRVARLVWKDRDENGVVDDTMSNQDAADWYNFYRVGAPQPDGTTALPADISQTATTDFLEFVQMLSKCNQLGRIQFMQLGDMVDYWIGFSSYFSPSIVPDPYVSVEPNTSIKILTRRQLITKVQAYNAWVAWEAANAAATAAAAMVGQIRPYDSADGSQKVDATETLPASRCMDNLTYWTNNLFNNTVHGDKLKQALTMLAGFPNAPIFLAGNHDCYLGSSTVGTAMMSVLGASGSGAVNPFPQRLARWTGNGIWMEHGHQCDSANGNNTGVIPATQLIIGTDSPLGEMSTQAAFLRPKAMRSFEGAATGAIHDIKQNVGKDAGFGQRFDQIGYAINLHDTNSAFRIYVMGHTHAPVLLNVVITDKPRVGPQSITNSLFQAGGVVTANVTNPLSTSSDQFEGVTFSWDKFQFPDGVQPSGHINLEEPWGPEKKPVRNYPRNNVGKANPLKFDVKSTTGTSDPFVVPPGALVPRYYPGSDNDAYLWSGPPLLFAGISFDTGQSMFGPNQPIALRWAFDPSDPNMPGASGYPGSPISFEAYCGLQSTPSSPMQWRFLGQQLALPADDQAAYKNGRTVFQKTGKIVANIAQACTDLLTAWNSADPIVMPIEPGGKAIIPPNFYIFMFATQAKQGTVDEGSMTPAVGQANFDTFTANNKGAYFKLRLWMRVTIPDSMKAQGS